MTEVRARLTQSSSVVPATTRGRSFAAVRAWPETIVIGLPALTIVNRASTELRLALWIVCNDFARIQPGCRVPCQCVPSVFLITHGQRRLQWSVFLGVRGVVIGIGGGVGVAQRWATIVDQWPGITVI